MKQDIGFVKNELNDQTYADLKVANGDLVADEGLETAVLISLFTDRYVPAEELPPGLFETSGWWGDALSDLPEDRIGSRLWLIFARGKIDVSTKNKMKDYAQEALEWMVSEGVAAKIEVSTVLVQNTRIELTVKIYRPNGDNFPFLFLWDGQELKRG